MPYDPRMQRGGMMPSQQAVFDPYATPENVRSGRRARSSPRRPRRSSPSSGTRAYRHRRKTPTAKTPRPASRNRRCSTC